MIKPDVLRELVSLITTEPPSETDLSEQYRYPNLACELLTSDLPALNERLASEEILNKLYQFLQNEPPLNPLLSSYFSRTLSILISRKSEQVHDTLTFCLILIWMLVSTEIFSSSELVFLPIYLSTNFRIFESQRRISRIITKTHGYFVDNGSHAQSCYTDRRPRIEAIIMECEFQF